MAKSELKATANRGKARGLQKLRWYCQMCEKQCRDDNGFKCRRQMDVFGQAPARAVARFSDEFLHAFLALLRRAHRGSRVAAAAVYGELVADRHHVHMNSTRWATLTQFVQFLGRQGLARVDLTDKGWFLVYVDRDSEQAANGRLKRKRIVVESEELVIARQIELARKSMAMANGNGDHGSEDECPGSCEADQEEQQEDAKEIDNATGKKIAIALQRAAPAAPGFNPLDSKPRMKFGSEEEGEEVSNKRGEKDGGKATDTRRRSAIDDLMEEEEKAKDRSNRKDHWLCPGVVVKVMSKSLGQCYYKQKGMVKRVIGKYVGEIEMLESKNVVRVDQDELETVVPQIGGLVRVVNGAYRGSNARLLSVDTEGFSARLRVEKGLYDGRVLKGVEYEDICKVAT